MSSKVYEGLMQKLATVLDVMDELNANQTSVEIRRKLVQTTNTFKSDMALAKEVSNSLQGGEFSIEDQESIIDTLEKLKVRKRDTLNKFAEEMNKAPHATKDTDFAMEIDSTASTPAA